MIRQLLDRRIPQFVMLYLAGSWGFLEFLDWAVNRYVLSPSLIDFVVALLLLFLPTVLVIAWRHGAPGPDEWRRTDAAAIGANVLVAVVVLFATFRDAELGAATTLKRVEDADGNTVERAVPKAGFRRRVLVFDFANDTGDDELDWLESGLGFALWTDLGQDPFVSGGGADPGVREFLAERGFEADGSVPLTLKREAARMRGMEHFLEGTIRRAADSTRVETRLYRADTGRLIASHAYDMADPRAVVDRISVDLRRDLGIPEGQIEQSVDLPVAELLTNSPEAFRFLARAYEELLGGDEPAAAGPLAERALAIDSTAAMAHLVRGNALMLAGDQAGAAASVAEALRYGYRLPERTRLALQVQNEYLFENDVEAALRAGRYWAEVYPEDVEARRLLANIYGSAGETGAQVRELRNLLALDGTDARAMRQLAGAYSADAAYDSALAWYERVIERQPSDVDLRLSMVWTLLTSGRFEEARASLEEAAVVGTRDPDVPRYSAMLDIRTGDHAAALERLDEVRALERTPAERLGRIELEETIHYELGQFDRLEDAYRRRLALMAESESPLRVVTGIVNSEFLLFASEAGRDPAALAEIDSLQSLVQPPWRHALAVPALRNHLGRGDVAAAREALAGMEAWLQFAGVSDARGGGISWAEGAIAALEDGDCRRALPLYERAVTANGESGLFRRSRLDCLTELGRWTGAETDAEWLMRRRPGRPTYRLAVARYEAARGRTGNALRHLDVALDVWADADADYLPAREARGLKASLLD